VTCECSCRPNDNSGHSTVKFEIAFRELGNDIARQTIHKRFHFNRITPESRLAGKLHRYEVTTRQPGRIDLCERWQREENWPEWYAASTVAEQVGKELPQ